MTADPVLEHWLFTVDEYERMAEVGILDADARVELLEGEIVAMSPIGAPHASVVNRANRLFVQRLGDRAVVSVQHPLRLVPRSEPEPDLVIARDRADFYASAHPTAADALLVVEVSDSSLRKDRRVKVPIYARQGVVEVWIVDLAGQRILVHTDPVEGVYRQIRSAGPGEQLSPLALPELTIGVDEVLGR